MTTKSNRHVEKRRRQTIFSNWTKHPARRGVRATPLPTSEYVNPGLVEGISEKYWRDLPTRFAMDARFDAYTEPRTIDIDEESYIWALRAVHDLVYKRTPRGSLKTAKFREVWDGLQHGSSSGFPDYGKKGDFRELSFREFARDAVVFESTWDVGVYPCSIAARAVVRERGENKPRLVWNYPLQQTVREGVFAVPLMASAMKWDFMGWTFRWLENGGGYNKWLSLKQRGQLAAMVDFSSFDATIPARMIRDSFFLILSLFSDVTTMEKNLFRNIVEYFIHTPIVYHDGVRQKHRGIPSGSWFTQIVGSLVNLIALHYTVARRGRPERLRWFNVLGDDSLTHWVEVYPDTFLQEQKQYYAELGLKMHPEKSKVIVYTDDDWEDNIVEYLGQTMVDRYPHLLVDIDTIKARLLIPEKRDKTMYDCGLRVIGLVWSYGYNQEVYRLLLGQWLHLLKHGMDPVKLSKFKTSDPEVARWFRFVFNEYGIDLHSFPNYLTIKRKYFGYV